MHLIFQSHDQLQWEIDSATAFVTVVSCTVTLCYEIQIAETRKDTIRFGIWKSNIIINFYGSSKLRCKAFIRSVAIKN